MKLLNSYFDFLAFYVKNFLSKIHTNCRLRSAGKLSGAEAVCQTGLPDTGISDHNNLTGTTAAHRRTVR